MLTVDIKNLLNRLNPVCTRALEGAAGPWGSPTHYRGAGGIMFGQLLAGSLSNIPTTRTKADIASTLSS